MPSPFPGMDPYLEAADRWPRFQQQFVLAIAEALQPSLGDRYRLRFANRGYTLRQPLFTSIVEEQHKEAFVEIRCRATDKLITHVDLVSPANRTVPESRQIYDLQRQAALAHGAHLVELELCLQGQPCVLADLDALPERQYVVVVTRATRPPRVDPAGTTLRKRLPRVRFPLATEDRDLILDLQTIFNRMYDRAFAGQMDYSGPPPVTLSPEDAAFVAEAVKEQGGKP